MCAAMPIPAKQKKVLIHLGAAKVPDELKDCGHTQ
jgi:hypothetical protein